MAKYCRMDSEMSRIVEAGEWESQFRVHEGEDGAVMNGDRMWMFRSKG